MTGLAWNPQGFLGPSSGRIIGRVDRDYHWGGRSKASRLAAIPALKGTRGRIRETLIIGR